MPKRTLIAVAVCLCCLVVGALRAETLRFEVPLTPEQAVPAPEGAENSRGHATITLDTETGRINVRGTYSGMSSIVLAAHVHGPAPRGENADAMVVIDHTGGTEGELILTGGILNAEAIQITLDGLAHVNVHTERNGEAEIRGQIENGEVPKVSMLNPWGIAALCVVLFGAAGLIARRRLAITASA